MFEPRALCKDRKRVGVDGGMNSFQLGIVVSLLCYLGIGWYAGRRVKHLEDFFVAGRNAPTILILGTLVASFMSTNAFMGEAGMSYMGLRHWSSS